MCIVGMPFTVCPATLLVVALPNVFFGSHTAIQEVGHELAHRLHRLFSFVKPLSNNEDDFMGDIL